MIGPEEIYKHRGFAVVLTKNMQDAEDLLHDVYLKLHNKRYEEVGKKDGYIKTAIYRKFIEIARKQQHRKWIDRTKIAPQQEQFSQHPILDADGQELKKLLYQRIDKVKECASKKTEALETEAFLMWLLQKSQKEIAQILDVPQNTAAGMIFRGKKRFIQMNKDLKQWLN